MLIVAYDFSNNKVRARFSKFLKKYGEKLQYSVYGIKNSKKLLDIILNEIEMSYKKDFKNTDSIMIFTLCEGCYKKMVRYGSAKHYDKNVISLD
jgi:CRISPR-associated endonuclease Cas2